MKVFREKNFNDITRVREELDSSLKASFIPLHDLQSEYRNFKEIFGKSTLQIFYDIGLFNRFEKNTKFSKKILLLEKTPAWELKKSKY